MKLMSVTRSLMFAKSFIWAYLGFLYWMHGADNGLLSLPIVIALFALNALVFAFLGWQIIAKKPIYYYATLIFVSINIILTIIDQMGLWDFIVLAIDSVLIFLLAFRYQYFLSR